MTKLFFTRSPVNHRTITEHLLPSSFVPSFSNYNRTFTKIIVHLQVPKNLSNCEKISVQGIVWSKVQIRSNTLRLVKVYFYDFDISTNEEGLKRPVGLRKSSHTDIHAVKDLA